MAWTHWLLSKMAKLGDTFRAVTFGQDPTDPNGEGNALIVEKTAGAARMVPGTVGPGGAWTPAGAPPAASSDYDIVTVPLSPAGTNAEILSGAASVSGQSWIVWSCDGALTLKLNATSKPGIPLDAGKVGWGMGDEPFTKLYGTWTDQPGKSLVLAVQKA